MSQENATPANLPLRFILLCLQGRFDPRPLAMAHELAQNKELDWELVEQLLEREALAPLLHAVVQGRNLLPAEIEKSIRKSYLRNAFRNTIYLTELAKLLDSLKKAEIVTVILKGAALAESVYQNVAERSMVDIDILVHRQDVSTVTSALVSLGYNLTEAEEHAGMITEYENELAMRKPGYVDIALEIHWSLLDSPHYQQKMDMGWFWDTVVPARFNDREGLVLGPEALLLHLCSHLMLHHRGEGLLWLNDIAEVLHRYQALLDWETIVAQAQAFDLVLSLQCILSRVSDQWNAPLPAGMLQRINGLQPSPREKQLFDWLTAESRPVAQRFWVDLATSSGWRSRLRYAWKNLFPSADYMRHRYEIKRPFLLPFYYPYRWFLGLSSMLKG